jgi:hypothetical protein
MIPLVTRLPNSPVWAASTISTSQRSPTKLGSFCNIPSPFVAVPQGQRLA